MQLIANLFWIRFGTCQGIVFYDITEFSEGIQIIEQRSFINTSYACHFPICYGTSRKGRQNAEIFFQLF